MSGIDGCYFEGGWGFLQNETKKAPKDYIITSISLRLTRDEHKAFMDMRNSQELSANALVRQALGVLQMYRAGRLAPVLDDTEVGGCGTCE